MLGSRRLAILDLAPRGRQAMRDHTGNLTIAFKIAAISTFAPPAPILS
jgi:hypothetical protein